MRLVANVISLWTKSMRGALRVIAVVTTVSATCLIFFFIFPAIAQSSLPPCPGESPESSWDNCQGSKTFATGGKYFGEFRDGRLNGRGTHTYTNGSKYVGEFSEGNFNGQGTLSHVNGYKYVGEFAEGKPNGQGAQTYADGSKYVGEFSDGQPNGRGTRTF